MIKRSTVLWMFFAAGSGVMTYVVKQCVLSVEKDLRRTESAVYQLQESLHLLRAEWASLNDPVRLQRLAEVHLCHGPVSPDQLVAFHELPDKNNGLSPLLDEASMRLASVRGGL